MDLQEGYTIWDVPLFLYNYHYKGKSSIFVVI